MSKTVPALCLVLVLVALLVSCSPERPHIDDPPQGNALDQNIGGSSGGDGGEDNEGGSGGEPAGPPPSPGRGILWTDESGGQYWVEANMVFVSVSEAAYPWSDPNWFDIERSEAEYDSYYAWAYGGYRSEPEFVAFMEAEDVTVDEWWDIKGAELVLPEGQSVQDAVENWPKEYSILSWVSPIAIED